MTRNAPDVKRVLVISPHFPPVNAPDMHRVRQSLPYFAESGWEAVTLAVDPDFVEGYRDEQLLATLPADAEIHRVRAFDTRWTRRFGLGSLALRSLRYYRHAGDRLLAERPFDLVYFSTTAFPVLILGPYWKRRFGVPFVVDMQDPWPNEYFLTRPPHERPPKFWFAYRLDATLAPPVMRSVSGVVSVSQAYCDVLQARYPNIGPEACRVIPFGGPASDFEALDRLDVPNPVFERRPGVVNVVYVGRGGHDMARAAQAVFGALADGLARQPELFEPVRLHFIGTDYAPAGQGKRMLLPLAEATGVGDRVDEQPARVPYFTALQLLRDADLLLVPGSGDADYTASKLYPYILARRPLLAVFHEQSSVVDVLRRTRAGDVVTFGDATDADALRARVGASWTGLLERLPFTPDTDWAAFEPYTARAMTRQQVAFFDEVLMQAGRLRLLDTPR